MDNELIGWTTTWNVKDAAAFRTICNETSRAVEGSEPGAIVYEWFMNDDGKTAVIHEWFAGNEGAKAHLNGVAPNEYVPKLLECSELAGLQVFGNVDEELRVGLADWHPSMVAGRIGGFNRIAGATITA